MKVQNKIDIRKIMIIYILIQPIIDMLTSLSVRFVSTSLTIGIFVRTLFMVGIAIYGIVIANKKERKYIIAYFSVIALYIIIFMIYNFSKTGMNMIVYQLKSIVKTFYFPVMLVAMIPISKKSPIEEKYLTYTLLGYLGILTLSNMLGIAFDSYADGSKPGKNGLFYAANEIGTILCILMPYLFLEIAEIKTLKNKHIIVQLLTLIFLIISSLWLGTKVPFLGLIIALFLTLVACIINIIKKQSIKINIFKSIGILAIYLCIFFTVGYTPIGKNLNLSIKKINNIMNSDNENFDNKTNKKEERWEEYKTKKKIIEETKSVMVSNRDMFLNETKQVYKDSSIITKTIGIGYLDNNNGDVFERKLIEMDYHDIFYHNGIFGFIIYFIPLAFVLIKVIVKLWKNKKLVFRNDIIFSLYTIGIALGIAGLSGHMLVAPAVSFYIALELNRIVYILSIEEKKK